MDTTNDITPKDSVVPVFLVPLTDEEKRADELAVAARESQEQAALAVRESAVKKLKKLGLTTDEVTALLGA